VGTLRIVATHPKDWSSGKYRVQGVIVRHAEIGAPVPTRMDGEVSYDGIGQQVTEQGFHELRELVTRFKPHVLFFGIHMGFNKRHLKLLRHRCERMRFVMHYTDQRPSVSRFIKEHGEEIDLLLITNRDPRDAQMYRRTGHERVRTFYDGVSVEDYWPKPMRPKFDCFFGGNNFWGLNKRLERQKRNHPAPWIRKFTGAKFREDFVLAVNKQFNLTVRGNVGWEDCKSLNVKPPLYHPNYLNALRGAKIVLNTINVHRKGLLTRRFLRSMAAGRLFMTEYCQGMERYFKNHEHLVWFKTVEEGLDLIRYYLDHDEDRERIARRGRKIVSERHTFRQRLKEFAGIAREVFNVE